jgi:hypothetical protein
MGLESATYIDDLDPANPISSDKRKQGDDHLRLIKDVLQNTFPTTPRAFFFPSTSVQTVDFAVSWDDQHRTFLIDTSGGEVTVTLTSADFAASDAGWEATFIKTTTDTNAYFFVIDSGTFSSGEIAGLTKARRCVPGHPTKVRWTGSAFMVERIINSPIGTILDCPVSSLPVGYEWANGQTLTSASSKYPEYFAANGSSGVVPDRRGRLVAGRDDMGGSAANRITNAGSGITGTTLGATGGAETVVVLQANLPNVSFTVDIPSGQGSHTHTGTSPIGLNGGLGGSTPGNASGSGTNTLTINSATLPSMSGTAASGGSDTALNKMPPTQITNMIVVVE